jgi:hypothetical protein
LKFRVKSENYLEDSESWMEGPTVLSTNTDDVDDDLALSPEALRALQEFILEQSAKQQEQPAEEEFVDEDWQLSQFWVTKKQYFNRNAYLKYTDETADSIAKEALRYSENGKIACVRLVFSSLTA